MDVLGVLNHPIEGLGTLAEILSERGFRVREVFSINGKIEPLKASSFTVFGRFLST